MQNVIDFDLLEEYDKLLKDVLEVWRKEKSYSLGDIVKYKGHSLECTTAGTSGTTTLNFIGLDIGDTITDGTVVWTIIEEASGKGLEDWQANKDYKAEDVFVYENNIYKALVGYTSGATFSEIAILDDYTLISWQANTLYTAGEYFEESGVVYEVLNNFTSGGTFSVTSDIAIYTPITWAEGTDVNTNDIVEDSGNYYIALVNFTCGDTFTKTAFEQYVPKKLTQTQIEEVIEAFNPAFDGALGFVVQDSAPAHNAAFRSNDLTDYFNSGQMSEAIADGSFRNIFPGDYIIKSVTVDGTTYNDVKWIVGDCDYYLHSGDTECTTHHVLVFPEICIGTSYMNSSNTISGGYVGSYMWTTTIPKYNTGIESAFGSSHVLEHKEAIVTGATNNRSAVLGSFNGCAMTWAYINTKVSLFNSNMILADGALNSSFVDTIGGETQVSVFRYNRSLIFDRNTNYWLRSISYTDGFGNIQATGRLEVNGSSNVFGVRPYFLLK